MKKNKTWHICADWSPRYVIRGCKVQRGNNTMRKFIFVFLCLTILAGCSHQSENGGLETTNITTIQNTTDYDLSEMIFECNDWIINEFDERINLISPESGKGQENITIVLYFDTSNIEEINGLLTNGQNMIIVPFLGTEYQNYYSGYFDIVEDGLYKFVVSEYHGNNILLEENELEGYFIIDQKKLNYLGDRIRETNNYCLLK